MSQKDADGILIVGAAEPRDTSIEFFDILRELGKYDRLALIPAKHKISGQTVALIGGVLGNDPRDGSLNVTLLGRAFLDEEDAVNFEVNSATIITAFGQTPPPASREDG